VSYASVSSFLAVFPANVSIRVNQIFYIDCYINIPCWFCEVSCFRPEHVFLCVSEYGLSELVSVVKQCIVAGMCVVDQL